MLTNFSINAIISTRVKLEFREVMTTSSPRLFVLREGKLCATRKKALH